MPNTSSRKAHSGSVSAPSSQSNFSIMCSCTSSCVVRSFAAVTIRSAGSRASACEKVSDENSVFVAWSYSQAVASSFRRALMTETLRSGASVSTWSSENTIDANRPAASAGPVSERK